MRTKLLLLSFLLTALSAYSQEYIFGKVRSEFGSELPNAVIINTRTDEKVNSDKDGNYMISAKPSDELRFVKSGYERTSAKISIDNYSQPLNISLTKSAYLIEEIELAFQATGNLKKDVKSLDPPRRVVALNSSMDSYMKTPPAQPSPKLTTPSAFAPKNLGAGQMDLLGLASAVSELFGKATKDPVTTATYAETQEFYRRIKTTLDLSFYTKQGWDEEEIDRFLLYADRNFSLAKKYRKSFDVAAIGFDMKMAYQEYIKTHKVGS